MSKDIELQNNSFIKNEMIEIDNSLIQIKSDIDNIKKRLNSRPKISREDLLASVDYGFDLNKKLEMEKKIRQILFDNLILLVEDMSQILVNDTKIRKCIGFNQEVPNIYITLNNKLVELQNIFKYNGISFYVDYDKEGDCLIPSFLGRIIYEFLVDYIELGVDEFSNYIRNQTTYLKQLQQVTSDLAQESVNKKRFYTKKSELEPTQKEYQFNLKDELKNIKESLLLYIEKNNNLFKMSLRDFIVDAVVQYIDKSNYSSSVIPSLLDEYIIESFNKLGLSDLLNELYQKLNDLYKSKWPYEELFLNIQSNIQK